MCPTPTQTCNIATQMCCDNTPPPVTTTTLPPTIRPTTTVVPVTTVPGCVDTATNCVTNANLCNNADYFNLMTQRCARTCGRCGGVVVTTTASTACKFHLGQI